jgi:hypothetical protein
VRFITAANKKTSLLELTLGDLGVLAVQTDLLWQFVAVVAAVMAVVPQF